MDERSVQVRGDAPAAGRAASPLRTPLVVAGSVVAATALVAIHSPYVSGSYGYCPLHALTGLWCPMCGGLRATHDLAHADLAGAWAMNPLWVVAVPFLVAFWTVWTVRAARGLRAPALPRTAWLVVAAVVLVFAVLRNVPALAPWLAP